MKKRTVVLTALIILLVYLGLKMLQKTPQQEVILNEKSDLQVKRRTPASLSQTSVERPNRSKKSAFVMENKESSGDLPLDTTPSKAEEFAYSDDAEKTGRNENTPSNISNGSFQYGEGQEQSASSRSNNTSKLDSAGVQYSDGSQAFTNVTWPSNNSDKSETPYNQADEDRTSPRVVRDPEIPTCSINNTGGTFQQKISLEISCSTASTIKYCIAEQCCDPEDGDTYSGPFLLGETGKTLCVSFAGISNEENISSERKDYFYTFNSSVPHLEMVQTKSFIQTTQLDASMILRSNNFGMEEHYMGVVNLFDHQTDQMTCEEIVETHMSFISPLTRFIFPELSIASFSSNQQMNLSIPLDYLEYGQNNLMAYVRSQYFVDPLYACSQSELILEDFYYSQTLPVNRVTTSDSILYGGFTPFHTQLEDPDIYRGPASDLNGEDHELRSGLISVFFEQ